MAPPSERSPMPEVVLPDPQQVEPEPELSSAGRTVRKKRLTWKLLQSIPDPPRPAPEAAASDGTDILTDCASEPLGFVWQGIKTIQNSFGLYREYPDIPSHNPDDTITLADLSDAAPPLSTTDNPPSSTSRLALPVIDASTSSVNEWHPFASSTIFGLMNWMWTGSPLKSVGEMACLIFFLKSDDFCKEDLEGFDLQRETNRFDMHLAPSSLDDSDAAATSSGPKDGWREVEVDIQIPDGKSHNSADTIPVFTVPGLHLRSIVEVIKSVFSDRDSRSFHYTPFKQWWSPPSDPDADPQRICDEIYSSDAMIQEHMSLQQQPPEPGCSLERVVVALMFWSDSTHLASFGNASLWPLYLFFGNQSKWRRGKPRTASCHHVAYIPKVSPIIVCLLTIVFTYCFAAPRQYQ
ncbi:hypothetical protein Hypma_014984 [Hypsizygus marmoreus]|uniref:Uncharacterized protein n=1 Tax=Hypsizygus marmoreus TaxID=39966 RepID=A0A369K9M2_HYPMA|nr:hypothetical protein Hypma_014984 [Hypsizygus marmoreus]